MSIHAPVYPSRPCLSLLSEKPPLIFDINTKVYQSPTLVNPSENDLTQVMHTYP